MVSDKADGQGRPTVHRSPVRWKVVELFLKEPQDRRRMVLPTHMFRLDYLTASLAIPWRGISIEKQGISELTARLVKKLRLNTTHGYAACRGRMDLAR